MEAIKVTISRKEVTNNAGIKRNKKVNQNHGYSTSTGLGKTGAHLFEFTLFVTIMIS